MKSVHSFLHHQQLQTLLKKSRQLHTINRYIQSMLAVNLRDHCRAADMKNGRLTLVLSPSAEPVRSLWATMAGVDLTAAREALRLREGISANNATRYIASWTRGQQNPQCVLELRPWAESRGIESVVWTALPPSCLTR